MENMYKNIHTYAASYVHKYDFPAALCICMQASMDGHMQIAKLFLDHS